MYKILIVEDDAAIVAAISAQLKRWDMEPIPVRDFHRVADEFDAIQPHLILMDLMLPYYNGFYWCQELRRLTKAPIVFLSSASDDMNIIMAMNMGGDDFVNKPVDLNVLVAKLSAVLRRAYDMNDSKPELCHNGVSLNLNNMILEWHEQTLELTKNEFRIMQTLLENHGRVISRDTLMTALWQTDDYVEENTLTINVSRLRKRLAGLGLDDFIRTRVGCGYIIE